MANSNISTELVQSYSYKDLDGDAVKASYSALKSGQLIMLMFQEFLS